MSSMIHWLYRAEHILIGILVLSTRDYDGHAKPASSQLLFCESLPVTLHQHFHFKNSPLLPYLDSFDDLPISANCIGLLFVEQHARSGALKSNIDYTK
jgi:hypothetical protein